MPDSDLEEIKRAIQLLIEPGQVVELRALHVSTTQNKYPHTSSGYYDDLDRLAQDAARVAPHAGGVYFSLNPVKPALLARAVNRIRQVGAQDALTGDRDIQHRRFLLFDLDPQRPAGISSSDDEHEQALQRARELMTDLRGQGWPEGILADSGNGAHLLYRIELPAEDQGLVKAVLESTAFRYTDDAVAVDTSVHNPGRIVKVYGTPARKGDNTADRPHRLSRLLSVPEHLEAVPPALLQALARSQPEAPYPTQDHKGRSFEKRLDLQAWIADHRLDVTGPVTWNGGKKWIFRVCPWNPDHTNRSAFILQLPLGAISAGCLHQSCRDKKWSDLRSLAEPGWQKQRIRNDLPALTNTKMDRGPSQSAVLVDLAKAGAAFFQDTNGVPYAFLQVEGHQEVAALRSKSFREWLSRTYYMKSRGVPGSQAMQDAIDLLAACAIYESPSRPVYTRLGALDGNVYFDLSDAAWRVVEIRPDGWRVVSRSPVAFRRPRNAIALPVPEAGGRLEDLLDFLNLDGPLDRRLLIAFLLGCLAPESPYPILALSGEHGTAKTTTSRAIKHLLDPISPLLRSTPRDQRDLMIAAQSNWILVFDNLSRLPIWLSDALCRLSTGGGFGARQLYSDDDEVIFDARRPVILNGIEEVVTRGDLLDRTIILELPKIPEQARVEERHFWQEFSQRLPLILGALLDAASAALKNRSTLKLPGMPRMADFAAWVSAAEPALGWPSGAFLREYNTNHARANLVVVETSLAASALLAFLGGLPAQQHQPVWRGTAAQLLESLEQANPQIRLERSWLPHHLSGELRRLAPNLRKEGIDVRFDERAGQGRDRLIEICTSNSSADAVLRLDSGAGHPESSQDCSSEYEGDSASAGAAENPHPAREVLEL